MDRRASSAAAACRPQAGQLETTPLAGKLRSVCLREAVTTVPSTPETLHARRSYQAHLRRLGSPLFRGRDGGGPPSRAVRGPAPLSPWPLCGLGAVVCARP